MCVGCLFQCSGGVWFYGLLLFEEYVCVITKLTVRVWLARVPPGVTQAAVGVGSGLFPTLHAPPSAAAPFGSSSLGTIGSPATTNTSLQTGQLLHHQTHIHYLFFYRCACVSLYYLESASCY